MKKSKRYNDDSFRVIKEIIYLVQENKLPDQLMKYYARHRDGLLKQLLIPDFEIITKSEREPAELPAVLDCTRSVYGKMPFRKKDCGMDYEGLPKTYGSAPKRTATYWNVKCDVTTEELLGYLDPESSGSLKMLAFHPTHIKHVVQAEEKRLRQLRKKISMQEFKKIEPIRFTFLVLDIDNELRPLSFIIDTRPKVRNFFSYDQRKSKECWAKEGVLVI